MSETDQTTETEVTTPAMTDRYAMMLQVQAQAEMLELQTKNQRDLEQSRKNHETAMESRRIKIDMIKVATDTLTSNAKSKPVDERDITASDIKTFADELIQYINEE